MSDSLFNAIEKALFGKEVDVFNKNEEVIVQKNSLPRKEYSGLIKKVTSKFYEVEFNSTTLKFSIKTLESVTGKKGFKLILKKK